MRHYQDIELEEQLRAAEEEWRHHAAAQDQDLPPAPPSHLDEPGNCWACGDSYSKNPNVDHRCRKLGASF